MARGEGTTGPERDQVSLRNKLVGPVVSANAADRNSSKGSGSCGLQHFHLPADFRFEFSLVVHLQRTDNGRV
jgi:hypothetical protein